MKEITRRNTDCTNEFCNLSIKVPSEMINANRMKVISLHKCIFSTWVTLFVGLILLRRCWRCVRSQVERMKTALRIMITGFSKKNLTKATVVIPKIKIMLLNHVHRNFNAMIEKIPISTGSRDRYLVPIERKFDVGIPKPIRSNRKINILVIYQSLYFGIWMDSLGDYYLVTMGANLKKNFWIIWCQRTDKDDLRFWWKDLGRDIFQIRKNQSLPWLCFRKGA